MNKESLKKVIVLFSIALAGGIIALSLNRWLTKNDRSSISEIQQMYATNGMAVSSIPNVNFVEVAGKAVHTVVHIKTTYGGGGEEKSTDEENL